MHFIAIGALLMLAAGLIYRRRRALRQLDAEIGRELREGALRGTLEWRGTACGDLETAIPSTDSETYVENWEKLLAQTYFKVGALPPAFRVTGFDDHDGYRMVCIRIGGASSAAYLRLELRGILDLAENIAVDVEARGSIGPRPRSSGTLRAKGVGNGFVRLTGTLFDQTGQPESVDAMLHPAILEAGDSSLAFDLDTWVALRGTLGTATYAELATALAENPALTACELDRVHSSLSSELNLHIGRLIRNKGLTTIVQPEREIYMGGVELFVAGVERVQHKGAKLYVHRWTDYGGFDVKDLPADHPFHLRRRDYFAEMLGPVAGPAFYEFTLDFAPGEEAKLLTDDEIMRFGLATRVDDEDYAAEQALSNLSRKLDIYGRRGGTAQ